MANKIELVDMDRFRGMENDLLDACLTICSLCVRLNPQHKGCNRCTDMDDLTESIKDRWQEETGGNDK